MHPDLSFDQAPPISVPYRFFLTAPLFGVAAGVLLAVQGGEMLQSRWTASTLAATHLLVAGFMLQAMCGALLQFIPVAAGGNIWRPVMVASLVHPLLMVSALLLVAAFLSQQNLLFVAAAHGFLIGLGVFLLAVTHALWRTPARGATIVTLRLSVIGLLITLALGSFLAMGLARASEMPLLALVDIHAGWGLWGWALLLLSGVAYFVVPMFQLTPAYPTWFSRSFPWLILAILLAWSMQLIGYSAAIQNAVLVLGLVGAAAFAGITLYLQSRRRRKVSDATLHYFRLAMVCLVMMPAIMLFALMFDTVLQDARLPVAMGILALAGVFYSVIAGMLYKIVPFLGWLHLQRACGFHSMPPTMNQILHDSRMQWQLKLHLCALMGLFVAVWLPQLARIAGVIFALDCLWLWANLLGAVNAYGRFKDRIPAVS